MHKTTIMGLMLLLMVVMPVMAQDATLEPAAIEGVTTEAAAGVVDGMTAEAAAGVVDGMTAEAAAGVTIAGTLIPYDFVLQVIQWGVTMAFFVLIYRSVPSTLIDDGIRLARRGADKTDTLVDDEIIEMLARLLNQRQDKADGDPAT